MCQDKFATYIKFSHLIPTGPGVANCHVVKVLELHHEVVGSTSLHSLDHAQLHGKSKKTCIMDSNDKVEKHYYI